ncbi:hypothetical protein D3872_18300 [Massilia cavernae]|uniref:Uncharacterized protein n=1 Tax=Massilia cavernae TaxID=2320864 RepID=A0A418XGX6_9BURK|nr:hypothetical protein D3872_18300 [Massilia cavernae]
MCECIKTDCLGTRGLREMAGECGTGEHEHAQQDSSNSNDSVLITHDHLPRFQIQQLFFKQYVHCIFDLQSDKDGKSELIVQEFEQYEAL